MATRVGFCGMGTMGAAMAANIARAGYPLTVWNRTPGRATLPLSLGAVEAATPRELAAVVDVVVVCVSDTPDVAAVLFGADGVEASAREGLLDILSSDYIPSSLLMAALQLPQCAPAIDLASAVRTVTKTPAEAVGLADRGEIAVGKRADLIRVHVARDIPVVRSVWREGLRVA